MTTQHFVHSCSDNRNIMINITAENKLFIFTLQKTLTVC